MHTYSKKMHTCKKIDSLYWFCNHLAIGGYEMRQRLWVMLSTLLVFSMLAACGNNNGAASQSPASESSPSEKASASASNDSPAPAADPVTIKYHSWLNNKGEEDLRLIIANFERDHPEIKVEYVPLVTNGDSTDYLKKLDVMMAASEEVDIASFPNVDFLLERAARGVLAPLDEFYKEEGVDPAAEYYINPMINGQIYGVQDLASLWLVALNESVLKEAGESVPQWGWTWDDYRDLAKRLTKGEGEQKRYGAFFHTWGEYDNLIAYTERPHPFVNADKQPIFDDPSYAQFFNLRRAMEQEDKSAAPLSDTLGAKLHYRTEFVNGKAAMVPTATFFLGQLMDRENNPHDFKTVFAPLPQSSKDAETGLSYIGGNFGAVGSSSKHKKESYQFLRYLSTQMDVIRDMPGWKKADAKLVIDKLIGDNKDLIDVDSLVNVMYDARVKTIYDASLSTPTSSQMKKVLEDGMSKFLLDNLSVEEAQQYMMDEAKKLK